MVREKRRRKYLCINPSCRYSQEYFISMEDKRKCVLCKTQLELLNTKKEIKLKGENYFK